VLRPACEKVPPHAKKATNVSGKLVHFHVAPGPIQNCLNLIMKKLNLRHGRKHGRGQTWKYKALRDDKIDQPPRSPAGDPSVAVG
ncbi:MAG: hypothetical protein ACJAQW_000908, partial [Paracoccaceae bacterium]